MKYGLGLPVHQSLSSRANGRSLVPKPTNCLSMDIPCRCSNMYHIERSVGIFSFNMRNVTSTTTASVLNGLCITFIQVILLVPRIWVMMQLVVGCIMSGRLDICQHALYYSTLITYAQLMHVSVLSSWKERPLYMPSSISGWALITSVRSTSLPNTNAVSAKYGSIFSPFCDASIAMLLS